MKAGHFRCWHFSDIAILANVRFAPEAAVAETNVAL